MVVELHPSVDGFQSAPLTDVRGDIPGHDKVLRANLCFNPLPSRM